MPSYLITDTNGSQRTIVASAEYIAAYYPDAEQLPEPEPVPAAPAVPQRITRAQGKAALMQAGLWDQVLAFVQAIPDPEQKALAEIALNDTLEWERASPFLNQCGQQLGISSERMDELFTLAATFVF